MKPGSNRATSSYPRQCSRRLAVPLFVLAFMAALLDGANGAESPAARFHRDVKPLLNKYCSDCHMDGMKKGNLAFDEFANDEELLAKKDLWFAVLKNVRAGIMPPEKKDRP